MITWHPHTTIPTGPETAVIAISDDANDNSPFLLPEIYRWDIAMGCWMGEANALLLKHAEFRWARETDILRTMP
jgi:hypothetical protein